MKIDLMLTRDEEAGLISNSPFDVPVSGVIYEHASGKLSIEFSDMESQELNIPVTKEFHEVMAYIDHIFIGVIEDTVITDARMVPMAHVKGGSVI